MSFGGILAQALAGGAGAIKDQATGDIADQRKAEMMRQEADIREQAEKRLIEFRSNADRIANKNKLTDTRDFQSSPETIAAADKVARAAGKTALDLKVAEATNPELAAAKDAQAEAELQREIRKIQATAKPEAEKAAAIAEARAKMEAKYRKADPTVQSKIAGWEKALGRPLTEQEKLGAMGLAKSGGGEETVETTEYDANGQPIKKRTVKGPRGAAQDAPAPIDPPAAAVDYLRKNPSLKAEFDAKFGKGAADRALAGAEQKPAATDKPTRPKPMIQTGPVALAESQLRQATERLNSYGSSQRQRDPDGFREAQARVAEARAALAAAQDADSGPITDSDRKPAMRYAAP